MAVRRRSIGPPTSTGARTGGLIVCVVALATLFRIVAFAAVSRDERKFYAPDSATYGRLAIGLRTWGAFTTARVPPLTPDLTRVPVYPAVVAGVFTLVGERPAAMIARGLTLEGER